MPAGQPKRKEKYGLYWPIMLDPVLIEMHMIKEGGHITKKNGEVVGHGLFYHYKELQKLLWPEDDHHRWSDLCLKTMIDNEVSVLVGSSDSGKTYTMSKYILSEWWTFPENTLWLISSTELRGAELRIWGALKQLFNRARERYSWLQGEVLESKHAITTEKISEDQSTARLLTKGLIFVPCKRGNTYVGMGPLVGVKPPKGGRLRHAGDELQFMQISFLDAYSNWYGKENFKGVMAGNPCDFDDPLCVAACPVGGWSNWKDTGKTQTWKSTFYNAGVVCLDGRDSPNLDVPENVPTPYPYLIGRKKINAVAKTNGEDSWQFWNQVVGKPRPGSESKRVITRELAEQFHAFEKAIWMNQERVNIVALDAAYGGVGGDRCAIVHAQFGKNAEDKTVISFSPVDVVPINIMLPVRAEDQIALFCRKYCEERGVPPENFFFDARASLALAFAQLWSPKVEVVDFGGSASNRVVSSDTYIWDGDTRTRRLQKCKELYSKFVTELWWRVHLIIVSDQMRDFPREAAEEFYKREWRYVSGNRIEVETKKEMKERTTYSPDLADCVVTACEGAIRRGFVIASLPGESQEEEDETWKRGLVDRARKIHSGMTLNYSV